MTRRRLVPGQSIVGALSARTHNDTVRVLEHADRYGLWAPQQSQPARRQPQATIFYARNDTGATLAIGDVVSLDGLGVDQGNYYGELKREITFAAGLVTASTGAKFGVCTEPIAANAFGPVAVSGACVCKVDVTDVTHAYASTSDGLSHLVSGADSGDAVILWQPGSPGVRECVVRIDKYGAGGAVDPDTIVLSGPFFKSSSNAAEIYSTETGHELYQSITGDAASIGLNILCDSTSVYNDPIAELTADGTYLLTHVSRAITNIDGTLDTATATTGAASAGTAHTHNVSYAIPHAMWANVYHQKRAGSVGAWSPVGSYVTTPKFKMLAWTDEVTGHCYVHTTSLIAENSGAQIGPIKWQAYETNSALASWIDSPTGYLVIRRIASSKLATSSL